VAQASRGVHGAARAAVAQAPGVREGFLRPSHWGVIGCAVAGLGLFAWQAELAPAHAQAQGTGGLLAKIEELEVNLAKRTNAAFVFIKPHACNDKVIALLKDTLANEGIEITATGSLDYKTIDEKMLIDNHYGAIASKAVKIDPKDLQPSDKAKAAFKAMAGMTWEDAVSKRLVYNAAQAAKKLNLDGNALEAKWAKIDKKKDLVKFGGGFYCGKLEEKMFVINGFYMAMRGQFTEKPAKIQWFTVQWDAAQLSWADFRGKVLGATDPTTAEEGSLRRIILDDYKKLGLAERPFTGKNGVHASASPFEAMAERANWLGADISKDVYGKTMLAAGLPMSTIVQWTQDPQVPLADGSKGSLFDALEDTNAAACLETSKRIASRK